MFYQILLFRPFQVLLCFFLRFTAFLFPSGQEIEEGSWVSGHVCFGTPPEGAELADFDTNRSIKWRVGAIRAPTPGSQINGGRTVEPTGPVVFTDG